jgi:surfactin family lipopeptide synthetase A
MGRSKDIIFVNGTNFYSHDLESVALQVPGVAMGKIVMSGYFDETEGRDKVITFLVGSDNEATRGLFQEVRQYFLNTLGLSLDLLIPIRSGDIPRTSSGKLQRHKMVSRFLKNEFPSVVRI